MPEGWEKTQMEEIFTPSRRMASSFFFDRQIFLVWQIGAHLTSHRHRFIKFSWAMMTNYWDTSVEYLSSTSIITLPCTRHLRMMHALSTEGAMETCRLMNLIQMENWCCLSLRWINTATCRDFFLPPTLLRTFYCAPIICSFIHRW